METQFRALTEADLEQVLVLRGVAFAPVTDVDAALATLRWRLPYAMGAFVRGRLVSKSVMVPFEAYVGGRKAPVGGLSGVATAPEARRHGLVAAALRRWFERLSDQGFGWSAEHPFDPAFYARLGYQTVPNGHTVQVSLARFRASVGRPPALDGELVAEPVGPEAVEELARTYDDFARRFSFVLTRRDGLKDYWGWTFRRPRDAVAHFAYRAGDAYVFFTTETREGGETLLWGRG